MLLISIGMLIQHFRRPHMTVFYRVVDDAESYSADTDGNILRTSKEQSTKRRWDGHKYNSTHMAPPTEWIEKYKEGYRQESDFDLRFSWGQYTPDALRAFLRVAPKLLALKVEQWPTDVRIAVGELDGTCSYRERREAWSYFLGCVTDDKGKVEVEKLVLDQTWIVEFEGQDMGISIPEEKRGGVQAQVITHGVMHRAEDFATDNGFPIPVAEDTGDPELPFEYE